MTTKKKSYASRLGILALVLALTSTCLLGGTMAKYATEVTGTGSATVAKWSFKVNGSDSTTMTAVDLAKTAYKNVASGKIAPGTQGSFDIKIDASGSDVAVDYAIAFSNVQHKPAALKFYSDANHTTEITDLANHDSLKGTIAVGAAELTQTIYWAWVDDAANDTATGKAAQDVSFDIKVSGAQQTPATS